MARNSTPAKKGAAGKATASKGTASKGAASKGGASKGAASSKTAVKGTASKGTAAKGGASKGAASKGSASGAAAKKSTASSPRKAAGAGMKDEQTMLRELFLDELRDIYWAEKHLTKALPKMLKSASSTELKSLFEQHIRVTEEQISRLDQAFQMLGIPARAIKCEGMEGLVREGQGVIEELPKGSSVRDAGLIISAQKIEHYEIAAYGSIVQLAKTLGENELATLLHQTLEEEKMTDQMLTDLAVSRVNENAEQEQ